MPKRAASSPAKHASSPKIAATTKELVSKKARTEQEPASPEAMVIATLAAADHLPKQCRDILQVSLPYCFATASAYRHKFQFEVLGGAQRILEDMEAAKRNTMSEEEGHLAAARAEKDAAIAECETKAESAAGKKKECDEKAGQVDDATKAAEAAAEIVKVARRRKDDCLSKKETVLAELADFQALMNTSYQQLKDGSFPKNEWRKRNKMITEFLQKVGPATKMEGALLDAMEVLFKTRLDQRGSFAKTTVEFVENALNNHTQNISQEIVALDDQATAHEKDIEADEAVLSEKRLQKESVEKEWDQAQKDWVDLDTEALRAKSAVQVIEMKMDEVQARVNLAKQALEHFLKVSAAFAHLSEPVKAEAETSAVQQPEFTEQPEHTSEKRSETFRVEESFQVA